MAKQEYEYQCECITALTPKRAAKKVTERANEMAAAGWLIAHTDITKLGAFITFVRNLT
jgi:hypothetical protein